jgi:hypothetical protein
MREEEKREKEEDISQLEETVATLRQQNEKERLALLELEDVLRNQKQEVEKHRRWAETQSSYRLCLERMIRDIMHQYVLSFTNAFLVLQKKINVLFLAQLIVGNVLLLCVCLSTMSYFVHEERLCEHFSVWKSDTSGVALSCTGAWHIRSKLA